MENLGTLRTRLIARLPLLVILMVGMGNALFAITAIVPPLKAHDALASQLEVGQATLSSRDKAQQDNVNVLNSQIDSAQAKLDKAAGNFWTELQVNGILDRLYEYADASGVKITNLQAMQTAVQNGQPAKNDGYDTRSFRLQVDGTVPQLINFIARIREAALPSVTLSSINISKGDTQNTLTMNIAILTSPYASGEVFSTLPQGSTPTRIPPTATPIPPTPTPTTTPTALPPTATKLPVTPSALPPTAIGAAPTATAPAAQKCTEQTVQSMKALTFSQVQPASAACQPQVWSIAFDRAYDFVVDIERRSGGGQYRMELHDSSDKVITTTLSSVDGRGLLVAKAAAGNYSLHVIPLTATNPWAYSIALWKGMPSLSFSFSQNSYSSHTSVADQANVTRWYYVLNSNQSYHVEVVRTDGKLEYNLVVRDGAGKQLATAQSKDGAVSLPVTSGGGTYYVEITALSGTNGSYRISLVP